MNQTQYFYEALESLLTNKLRSALTMLGIIIGVAAVIAMLAIGTGAQQAVDDQINSIGTNLIYISSGAQDVRNPRPLTLGDANALADPARAPSILRVAAVIQSRGAVSYRGESVSTSIVAVTPEYALIRNLAVMEGQGISASNMRLRQAVAVLGSDVALSLFGSTEGLVGKTIRVQNQVFSVIGVLESKGGSAFGSEDDQILVPLSIAESRLTRRQTRDQVDMIYVQAIQSDRMTQAVNEITKILATRHKVSQVKPDFSVLNQQDILETAQSITGIFTMVLGGIAGISLLVGGIGIMNIMYVSVSERTNEIGLRKAVGARKLDILVQFLTESALLSLLGGLIGIGLAWVIAQIIAAVASYNDVQFTPLIQIDAILLATIFSAAVGVFFGFYPALRAANLQPVEALRHE